MLKPIPVPQRDPPLPPQETLPTMYDLPSDNPEDSGLPDEFHLLQPALLTNTFNTPRYTQNEVFCGADMNLYYDVQHPLWYKRPDWFLVVGVPRLYAGKDLRNSYVIWQEGEHPYVIVELLSPGTAPEDLGDYASNDPEIVELDDDRNNPEKSSASETILEGNGSLSSRKIPLSKWDVYEQKLRVPYYVVFSRYINKLWFLKLEGGKYQKQKISAENPRLWIPELEAGLGLWQGEYQGINRLWLRWYDSQDRWIPTEAEDAIATAQQERILKKDAIARAQQAELQLQRVTLNLLQSGMAIEQVATITGVSVEKVQEMMEE